MTEFDPNTLAGRIEHRLKVVDLSPSAASLKATGSRDAIRKIFAKARDNEPFNPRLDTLSGLAKVLRTTTSWLTDAIGPEDADEADGALTGPGIPRSGNTPPFAGRVQAGVFLAVDEYFNQDPDTVPSYVLPDPSYPRVRQYAWQSFGDSMNRAGITDGMWIVGADAGDYVDNYGDMESGDLVIVERTKYQGAERELTVKEIHYFRDRYELRPVSTDASFEPIVVPHNHNGDTDGIEVKIIGVVLTAYANLRRPRR